MPASQFKSFFKKYSETLKNADCIKKSFDVLDKYPLMPSQAMYVVDWKELEIIYQRGIEQLLGYSAKDFSYLLHSEFYHPDDIECYVHLVQISNEWAREQKPEPFSVETTFDYRIRRKDGSFVKVLRQSTVFENCKDKSIKSALSILSDISDIKKSTTVNLSIRHAKTGRVLLEEAQAPNKKLAFSLRQIEILALLRDGLSSRDIAEQLHVSRHTVDTHRRNMLKKAGDKNVIELVQIAIRMGII